jgi:hypothetical protein
VHRIGSDAFAAIWETSLLMDTWRMLLLLLS